MGGEEVFALIVEDDEVLARDLRATLRADWGLVARIAPSALVARAVLGAGLRPRTFIIDVELPDGDGMCLAEELRPWFPHAPLLFQTAHCGHDLVNRAYRLDARYVCKPYRTADIALFVDRALAPVSIVERLRALVVALAVEVRLSVRERQLLERKLMHQSYEQIAAEWGVKPRSVQKAGHGLLCKTGDETMQMLLQRLWTSARAEPSRAEPSRAEPSRAEPSRASSGPRRLLVQGLVRAVRWHGLYNALHTRHPAVPVLVVEGGGVGWVGRGCEQRRHAIRLPRPETIPLTIRDHTRIWS